MNEDISITKPTEEELNDCWTDKFGVKYSKDKKRLLDCSEDLPSHYSIPEGTEVICDRAFWLYTDDLSSVTIPESVRHIGINPFNGCESLTNIDCRSKHFVFRDDALYTADMTRIISYIGKKDTFTIPDTVTHIGDETFEDCTFQSIIIPASVTHIGDDAFSYCESLQEIDIPDSVTYIGEGVFSGCSSLTSIHIPDSVTHIGDSAFSNCESLEHINIPNSVTSIGKKSVCKLL